MVSKKGRQWIRGCISVLRARVSGVSRLGFDCCELFCGIIVMVLRGRVLDDGAASCCSKKREYNLFVWSNQREMDVDRIELGLSERIFLSPSFLVVEKRNNIYWAIKSFPIE